MVSKVTAMALVAIIAVPILAGFALNFQDVSETKYTPGEVRTNVTPLLYNATDYDVVSANTYELNADNFTSYMNMASTWANDSYYVPYYNSYTTAESSLPYSSTIYTSEAPPSAVMADYNVYQLVNVNGILGLTVTISTPGQSDVTYNNVTTISYNDFHGEMRINNTNERYARNSTVSYTVSESFVTNNGELQIIENPKSGILSNYANISDGFKIKNNLSNWRSPGLAYNVLLTVDFTSLITTESVTTHTWADLHVIDQVHYENEDAFSGQINKIRISFDRDSRYDDFTMTIKASENTWLNLTDDVVLYRDSDKNTYQIKISGTGVQFFYIGGWPKTVGVANYYRSYDFNWETPLSEDNLIRGLRFDGVFTASVLSEGMSYRFDAATLRSSDYQIFKDKTYDPAQLTGANAQQTTITGVSRYGSAIEFGGNTYTVINRSITLGSRLNLSVNGLTFDSIPADGGYDNRINGYIVSHTSTPATITFDGSWLADVNTTLLKSETYTENKWIAGGFSFADGVGFDFYLIGLLTSIAAFIFLAMYGRRSGAKVGGLMIVCGGAAFMFILLM